MNYHKLLQYQQQNVYTDLALTLSDKFTQIIINVHKIILSLASIYFEKLLTLLTEKDHDNITITVPNAQVAYDIIMSFYGQEINNSDCKYILEFYQCCDFFGLKINTDKLANIEVPAENFELLLDTIEMIGYNDKTIEIINKNLPDEYDLSKFPNELIKEMINTTSIDMIIASEHKSIKILDSVTGKLVNTLNGNTDAIYDINVSNDNTRIISGGFDQSIKIWDIQSGVLINTLNEHDGSIFTICYSPDDKQIISGNSNSHINVWDANTGILMTSLHGHTQGILCVCVSSDGKRIISSGRDRSIKIWDAEKGILVQTLTGHTDWVYCICYSPDNKRIASGSDDKTIKIWNASTGELIKTLAGHTDDIHCVCYSSDTKRIISAGKDIKIWDAYTGNLLHTLHGHTATIHSICHSSRNELIVSGGYDSTIKIWNILTGELVNTLNQSTCHICYVNFNNQHYRKIINNLSLQQKIDLAIA